MDSVDGKRKLLRKRVACMEASKRYLYEFAGALGAEGGALELGTEERGEEMAPGARERGVLGEGESKEAPTSRGESMLIDSVDADLKSTEEGTMPAGVVRF